MASQIEREIREALYAVLQPLAWVAKCEPYKIRLGISELQETEVPYVQFYGVGQTYEPDRTELTTRWQLAVDVVLKVLGDGTIDQRDLDDKRQEVIEAVGADPKLGIKIIHIVPVSSTDDLMSFDPFIVSTIIFEVLYRKPFVREC
jgi:hypothetical protein